MTMKNTLVINGGIPLKGEVQLSGAKNVALKTIIAGLIFKSPVTLNNIPRIFDVITLMDLINDLGGSAQFTGTNTVVVDGTGISKNVVELLFASKIRVSFMMVAPLLHILKSAEIPNPGGCRLGARSIDRSIDGLCAIGIASEYNSDTGYYSLSRNAVLNGSYTFEKPSHTGTELLLLMSVLNSDTVVIHNASLEPEIDELIHMLIAGGARIVRDGSTIHIQGVENLIQQEPFLIGSDRNEAVTFAVAAIATKGDIVVKGIHANALTTFLDCLEKAHAGFEVIGNDSIRFYYKQPLLALDIETAPHPGFMTDWQPNWAVLMTQAIGISTIHERVFENRFSYVEELKKLGADIEFYAPEVQDPHSFYLFNYEDGKQYTHAIRINGPKPLHNGVLVIADLRAGATLLIAALIAKGTSILENVSILERGYEDIEQKITALGGNIQKR